MFVQHVLGRDGEVVCIPLSALGSEDAPMPKSWSYLRNALVFDSRETVTLYMQSPGAFPFSEYTRGIAIRKVHWWSRFLARK